MASDMIELVYGELKQQLNTVQEQVVIAQQQERALFSDSIPAYTVATLPTASDGGLGNNTSFVTVAWASNGRKSGEGVGTGTGTICFWQASLGKWLRITDNTQVVA